jgi:carbon starvation protein
MAFAVRRAKLGVAVFLVHSGWNHKMKNNNSLLRHLPWLLLAIVGACALGVVALRRGEAINALWIVVAAVAIYLVAYRYYSLFIANNVMQLDPRRATPAVLNNDGLDYVPTNKHILFGHHFAAIAGAGPLVGPVLAAQMGYLPGTLWLIAGVVLAGAVQDFMVLFMSTRRNGRSLGDMVREEMGRIPGTIALFGCFLIMIIILAVLALIVVKALAESPVHGHLHALHPSGSHWRNLRGRRGVAARFDLARWADCGGSGLGQGVQLHRDPDYLDADRLWFCRGGIAGVADSGPP